MSPIRGRWCVAVTCLLIASLTCAQTPSRVSPPRPETIEVDLKAAPRPFPHFWEKMFGSERAIVTLRESYRHDLREVKKIIQFEYVRFHAVFHDEMGVYDENEKGEPVYNFSYVAQVYDGLLENGVRPFVELSFMPKKLSATSTLHPFWYKPYPNPPKDWNRWEELVYHFTKFLVDRYGEQEVAQWYFEVWNEPNIDFWSGEPKWDTYMKLYEHAARGVKRASPRLRVGGPATAQAAWVDRFIAYCVEHKLPFDFVSTHVYANDTSKDVFGTDERIPRTQMLARAMKKVHDQVKASARPNIPIIWSEYNASYMNEPHVTDAEFMGPWLANTIRQTDGLADVLAYWTFSDVFEEQGVTKRPFCGGFGLLAEFSLPKPSFNAFALLHKLGEERISNASDSVLVTKKKDGSYVLAVWNLFLPEEPGSLKDVVLKFKGLGAKASARVYRVDREHGSLHKAYEAMGKPAVPSRAQILQLRKAAQLPLAESHSIPSGELKLTLPPHGLLVVEIH